VRLIAVLVALLALQGPPGREVAITFDDLPVASAVDREGAGWARVTADLLAAIGRHKVPAIGFVNEQRLERGGAVDAARVELLRAWVAAGLELGNHTYSHLDFHSSFVEDFQRDVAKGDVVTRRLLAEAGKPLRFFRHPFLHTGRTLAARRALERFLGARGYRVAPVTIDNYDYVFGAAFERADDDHARESIAAEYLRYMTAVVAYYEQQSTAIVGREIRQVLLLHANALNARSFDALASMLAARGYSFVPIERALQDEAYASPDTFVGPGGITWLHRWALTQGKRGGFFAGEPTVPAWIEQAALPAAKG
jgi:peptidoglycan/xylan/chitin deacetylase (PgdA/CDA1 family)